MFPLPANMDGLWNTLDQQPTWTWVLLEGDKIQIGVAGANVAGTLQRYGSVLTIRLAGSKPLVAYASLEDGVLELEFVTMKMAFIRHASLELESDQ